MADGLLSNILNFIDQRKQASMAGLGLLASNPQEYFTGRAEQLRDFTRAQEAGLPAERSQLRGLLVTPEQQAAQQYANQQLQDVALGFAGNIKPTSNFINEAHRVASKNAEKMLGLPPGNTAMDRARAMGYDTHAYHATNIEFNAFDPLKTKFNIKGTFTSKNPKEASAYVEPGNTGLPTKDAGGFVLPLMIKNKESISPEYFNISNIKKGLEQGKNVVGNDVIVIPEPNRIRSRFAAFDPARANESDLLAGVIPFGLLSGKDQLESKKEKKSKK